MRKLFMLMVIVASASMYGCFTSGYSECQPQNAVELKGSFIIASENVSAFPHPLCKFSELSRKLSQNMQKEGFKIKEHFCYGESNLGEIVKAGNYDYYIKANYSMSFSSHNYIVVHHTTYFASVCLNVYDNKGQKIETVFGYGERNITAGLATLAGSGIYTAMSLNRNNKELPLYPLVVPVAIDLVIAAEPTAENLSEAMDEAIWQAVLRLQNKNGVNSNRRKRNN